MLLFTNNYTVCTTRIWICVWDCCSSPSKCAPQPMIGMHQIRWESCDYSNINLHNGRWSGRSQHMRWTTFSPILCKEGYGAMDHWVPTNAADKNDTGMFLDYLENTLDDEISPHVRFHELKGIKKREDETINILFCASYTPNCSSCTDRWWKQWSCWVPMQADSCHSR